MSFLVEPEALGTLQFEWGKKRRFGKNNKQIQFYESFSYDGIDYTLYDNVYLYKKGEPAPYIGKLVKIWENHNQATNAKKVKVLWFFRPSEISNYLEEGSALEKELFLATGEGVGSADVNLLEAISGKCNVVCTSKDNRNTQPTVQEFESANYFFYRTFDVGCYTISDLTGDKVAGQEVKHMFNRTVNSINTEIKFEEKEEGEISASLSRGYANTESKNPNLSEVEDEVKVEKCSDTSNIDGKDSEILEKSPVFTGNKRKGGETQDFCGSNNIVKAAKRPRIDNSVTNSEKGKILQKVNASKCKKWKKPQNRRRKKKNW